MVYRVIIEKGEDFGYIAHCPAIPGCHSQEKTIEEAIENIKDAKRCHKGLSFGFRLRAAKSLDPRCVCFN